MLAQRVVIMSPRPGRVATMQDFTGPTPDRISPAYADRVAGLTKALEAVHAT
jgi:hypothetical protein